MGQTPSTPLGLVLSHFKDVKSRAHNLSVLVKKGKFSVLCRNEWLTFNAEWPEEGTFDLEIIREVERVIFQPHGGHLDQVPYIMVWKDLVENPPPWVKVFLPKQVKILAAGAAGERLSQKPQAKTFHQGGSVEEEIFPPPPYASTPPHPTQPTQA